MSNLLIFIAGVMKLAAAAILFGGALVASQKSPLTSADILLLSLGVVVASDIIRHAGGMFGNDSREKPTLPE